MWTDYGSNGFDESRSKCEHFRDAWFRLMEAMPELREAFALGDRVIVAGRDDRSRNRYRQESSQ